MTAADPAEEFAPAKVNLYLHLTGRRADGYHLLNSLAVFPKFGDRLSVAPGQGLSLRVTGPFGAALGEPADNLVLRAARALAEAHEFVPDVALTLEKHVPVASGIGGGSSDAAATLRLLARHWGVAVPEGLAPSLGADVPVCLGAPRAQFMSGIGDVLRPALALPPFWIVLANPGVAVETRAVFAAVVWREKPPAAPVPPLPDFAALVAWLGRQRNDLQAAAKVICPSVGEVLQALAEAPLARMSGSGATCFALHERETEARTQAARIAEAHPDWWVVSAPVSGSR